MNFIMLYKIQELFPPSTASYGLHTKILTCSICYCNFWWLFNILICLPCASWGDLLVSEGVHHYLQGSEFSGRSNGAIDPVITFWQGLCISFKVIVLGLRRYCAHCPGECSPWLTVPWKWKHWWVSLYWDPILSNTLPYYCFISYDSAEGERLIYNYSKKMRV